MKVYYSLNDVKKIRSGSIVAVGIFDGVHRGHIRMIKKLVKRARKTRRKSLILTFYPHPFSILHPKRTVPLLISLNHRIKLLGVLGIDIVVLIKFSKDFSKMKPETFVEDILLRRLNMKEMLVGDNFSFGWRAGGDVKLLKRISKKYGFKMIKTDLLRISTAGGRRIISSTYIRSLILNGKLNQASRLLGRPVSILGTVKKGTERGRILGYPTANIDPHHEAIPPSGVYAVYVKLDNRRCKGILNIGIRPTFHPIRYTLYAIRYPPEPTIEVHIFNFKRDIYGKDLEIIFVKRLRPERRFKDKESLIKRIKLDEKAAKKVFKRA